MLVILAPHPMYTASLILPEPQWGDGERRESTVDIQQMMNGDFYTYVQRNTVAKTYTYDFVLTRIKSLEFLSFYEGLSGELWKVGERVGYVKVNPLTLEMVRKGAVTLSFELETTQ